MIGIYITLVKMYTLILYVSCTMMYFRNMVRILGHDQSRLDVGRYGNHVVLNNTYKEQNMYPNSHLA